jgi:hypothetical protein
MAARTTYGHALHHNMQLFVHHFTAHLLSYHSLPNLPPFRVDALRLVRSGQTGAAVHGSRNLPSTLSEAV